MAVDMFIKIDGVDGESQDDAHAGEIDVLSWQWGAVNKGSAALGGGLGSGKVEVKDLYFTHFIDKASPLLFLCCCNGKHIAEAKLTCRRAGENPLEYLVVTMKNVLISEVQPLGDADKDRPMERVGLNVGEVEVKYTPQKADGTRDAEVTAGWNISKNVKL